MWLLLLWPLAGMVIPVNILIRVIELRLVLVLLLLLLLLRHLAIEDPRPTLHIVGLEVTIGINKALRNLIRIAVPLREMLVPATTTAAAAPLVIATTVITTTASASCLVFIVFAFTILIFIFILIWSL